MGDIAKAFGGGADFVMLGGMLAGHEECDGKLIEKNGHKFKQFFGNSSSTAMGNAGIELSEYRYSI